MSEEKQLFQQARDIMDKMESAELEEESTEEVEEIELEEENDDEEEVQEVTAMVTPMPTNVNMPWKMSSKTKNNIATSRSVFNMEHGILSGVPIICRTYQCPYKETCWIPETDLQYGERCPIEIAAILDRYDKYSAELFIKDGEDIDKGLLKELIDLEVMILRCDNLLATKGNLIDEVVSTVGDDGTAYYKPEISKESELKDRLRKERHRILQLLNSTRKDKKQQTEFTDPSSMVAGLLQKLRGMEKTETEIIDAEYHEDNKDVSKD